jgi:hypothetical protein
MIRKVVVSLYSTALFLMAPCLSEAQVGQVETTRKKILSSRTVVQRVEEIRPIPATGTHYLRFDSWTAKQHNASTYDTTSSAADLNFEVMRGARILKLDDGSYVQTLHKQYPSSCGPASLAMVLRQLGISREPAAVRMHELRRIGDMPGFLHRDVDIEGEERVQIGYDGSMEHLMWLGYHRKRLLREHTRWNDGDSTFMTVGGVLNTAASDLEKGFLALDGDMDYLSFTHIPGWLWRGRAVGCGGSTNYHGGLTGIMNYIYSGRRDGPWRDARPLFLYGNTDSEVVATRRIIKGFIDHGIAVVAGVDSGGHFNTVIGYRGVVEPVESPFWVYTADPLNGWGRSEERQPGTWRRILVTAENLYANEGILMALIIWNHHAEGGAAADFRPGEWAQAVDRANGNNWLTGNLPPAVDPLSDPLSRRAERMPVQLVRPIITVQPEKVKR